MKIIKHTHLILLIFVFTLFIMCCNLFESYKVKDSRINEY
uniref:Uncharacterized protein n=1 Tax=viral metagenome TaxID=1070528 RepID=A0A6C0EI71_9ZZZZ